MNIEVRHVRAARRPVERRMEPIAYSQNESGDVRKLLESIYELLHRQRWLILGIFVTILGASIVYVLRKAPEFKAESLIVVEEQKYDPSNALTMGNISGLDNSSTTMHLLVLAQSTGLSQRVADRVMAVGNVPGSTERFSLLAEEAPKEVLAKRIQSERISIKSSAPNVISITASGPTGPEAAALANLFAEQAIAQSKDLSRGRVATSRLFLEQRIQESREILEDAEQSLQQYLRREGAVAIDQEVQAAVSNLALIEAAKSEAQIELEMRNASLRSTEQELTEIRPMLSRRVASGLDRDIATGQQQLAELELRLEQIFQQYPHLREDPDSDPRIKPLQDEIAQWKHRIEDLSEQYVQEALGAGGLGPDSPESGVSYAASLERQLVTDRIAASGLASKIVALDRRRAQLEERLMQAPRQSVEIGQLQRARESSEQLYTYLEQRLQEAQLAEESETGSLRLLRFAEVPLRPVSPRPERIFPLSALLGLMVGLGAAALSVRLDRRLYTPTDVSENGFHLLSVIPDMRHLTSREFGRAKVVHVEGHNADINMVALLAPHTAAAEAYRHLYARLRPESDTSAVKSIIVTSPEANVGKSTTALNLALTAASARLRTLIVDVDMRRPAIESYLGISYRFTLQDIFELPDDEDVMPYVIRHSATGIHNLHAITVREPIQNPLEHLVSPRLRKLIELLKQEFDMVIFDAPPLLLTSDAAFLAPLCDATIVVVAAGETDTAALHQIETVLAECKAKLSGIVLNRFDASNRMFRSTYGYLEQNYSGYYSRAAN